MSRATDQTKPLIAHQRVANRLRQELIMSHGRYVRQRDLRGRSDLFDRSLTYRKAGKVIASAAFILALLTGEKLSDTSLKSLTDGTLHAVCKDFIKIHQAELAEIGISIPAKKKEQLSVLASSLSQLAGRVSIEEAKRQITNQRDLPRAVRQVIHHPHTYMKKAEAPRVVHVRIM